MNWMFFPFQIRVNNCFDCLCEEENGPICCIFLVFIYTRIYRSGRSKMDEYPIRTKELDLEKRKKVMIELIFALLRNA